VRAVLRRPEARVDAADEVRRHVTESRELGPAPALGCAGPAAVEVGGGRTGRPMRVVGARVRRGKARRVDGGLVRARGEQPRGRRGAQGGGQGTVGAPPFSSRSCAFCRVV
jgi:hypothetical protein